MARIVLDHDEERRLQEILAHFSPEKDPDLRKIREKLSDEEWLEAERVFSAAIRLNIEGRLLLTTLIDSARELGMTPDEESIAELKRECEIRHWLLISMPDWDGRFEIPTISSEDSQRVFDWLNENPQKVSREAGHAWRQAEIALGIDPAGDAGRHLFFEAVADVEATAAEMFFGDMDSQLQKLLDA